MGWVRGQRFWRLLPWFTVPVVLIACKPTLDDLTVWKTQLTSPDDQWIASARTIQNGGFGSANIETVVSLGRTGDSRTPQDIVDFDCNGPVPHPYTLDNIANRGGTIGLTMRWATPTHLVITYQSNPTIDFQVVKLQGIEIATLHRPSGAQSQDATP